MSVSLEEYELAKISIASVGKRCPEMSYTLMIKFKRLVIRVAREARISMKLHYK